MIPLRQLQTVVFDKLAGHALVLFDPFEQQLTWLNIIQLSGLDQSQYLINYHTGTNIPLTVEIVQDWTKMVIYTTTGTETSESYSYMASQFDIDGKSTRLTYTYTNKPFNAIADPDMQPHDGTASLVFRKSGKVKGTYFNARTRTGTIELTRKPKAE